AGLEVVVDREHACTGDHDGDGAEEIEQVEFDDRSTVFRELEDLVGEGQEDRNDHRRGYERGADPGLEAEDHHERTEHLSDVNAVRDESRQIACLQHLLDAADAVEDLVHAVKEHQSADAQPLNQESCTPETEWIFHNSVLT